MTEYLDKAAPIGDGAPENELDSVMAWLGPNPTGDEYRLFQTLLSG